MQLIERWNVEAETIISGIIVLLPDNMLCYVMYDVDSHLFWHNDSDAVYVSFYLTKMKIHDHFVNQACA